MELNYKQGKSHLALMRSNPRPWKGLPNLCQDLGNEMTDDDIFSHRGRFVVCVRDAASFSDLSPAQESAKDRYRPNSLARAGATRLATSSIHSHPAAFVIFRLRRISVAGVPLDCSPFHVGSTFRHLRTCPPRNDPISPLYSSSYSSQQNA
jgi:hypothetical protein